jgi:hypothetical protein
MVGDPKPLQAIDAGTAFRVRSEGVDVAGVTDIVRQRQS